MALLDVSLDLLQSFDIANVELLPCVLDFRVQLPHDVHDPIELEGLLVELLAIHLMLFWHVTIVHDIWIGIALGFLLGTIGWMLTLRRWWRRWNSMNWPFSSLRIDLRGEVAGSVEHHLHFELAALAQTPRGFAALQLLSCLQLTEPL